MANLKSSKKDIKRSLKARASNTAAKSAIKTYIKKAKKEGAGAETLTQAVKALDKAVQKGVIHKNQAARRKSRLAKATKAG
ncbi:MAG: 30S ribosomal protein S20 [Chthonomonadaceae bacterium]|jgi:small subunit ribosomal protein S20|nr:30S ribosomal protein S20 [Chthonomonadaceae bacterium]